MGASPAGSGSGHQVANDAGTGSGTTGKSRAFLDQVLDRSGDTLDWHVRIDAMLIKKVDDIGPQPFQRCLNRLTDVVGLMGS